MFPLRGGDVGAGSSEEIDQEIFLGRASSMRNKPMFTAPTIRRITADAPPTSDLAEIYETYFTTLERQAVRFENVASMLKDEDKQTALVFVAGLRKEVQTLRGQVDRYVERGYLSTGGNSE